MVRHLSLDVFAAFAATSGSRGLVAPFVAKVGSGPAGLTSTSVGPPGPRKRCQSDGWRGGGSRRSYHYCYPVLDGNLTHNRQTIWSLCTSGVKAEGLGPSLAVTPGGSPSAPVAPEPPEGLEGDIDGG